MRRQGAACVAVVVLASCTFGDLATYDVQVCDPSRPFYADACTAALPAPACQAYVCDPATRRCVLAPLDFDRDGDPPPACGGHDCDDTDPTNRGIGAEVCDGKDNNCNGAIDEELLRLTLSESLPVDAPQTDPQVVAPPSGGVAVATYVARSPTDSKPCLAATQVPSVGFGGGCAAYGGSPETDPRQPFTRIVLNAAGASALVTAYVTGSTCDSLGVRDTLGGGLELPCDGHVSLPAIGRTMDAFFAAYFDAPLADSTSPSGCPVAPASLWIRRIAAAAGERLGGYETSAPVLLTSRSRALRAPAIVEPSESEPPLVVAPDGDAVGYWTVKSDLAPPASIAPDGALAQLAGATSVAVALAPDGTYPRRFAMVAEVGCPPTTDIELAIGTLAFGATNTWTMVVERVVPVLPNVEFAGFAPAIAWTDDGTYQEWRVTWMTVDGAWLERFEGPGGALPEGTPVGDPIGLHLNIAATAAAPATDGYAAVLYGSPMSLLTRFRIGCSP